MAALKHLRNILPSRSNSRSLILTRTKDRLPYRVPSGSLLWVRTQAGKICPFWDWSRTFSGKVWACHVSRCTCKSLLSIKTMRKTCITIITVSSRPSVAHLEDMNCHCWVPW